eukprot:7391476-Prymnesium_polylepis.3
MELGGTFQPSSPSVRRAGSNHAVRKVEAARQSARNTRWRMTVALLAVAWLSQLMPAVAVLDWTGVIELSFSPFIFVAAIPIAVCLSIITVLPTDVRTIRAYSMIGVFGTLVDSGLAVVLGALIASGVMTVGPLSCKSDSTETRCAAGCTLLFGLAASQCVSAVWRIPLIRPPIGGHSLFSATARERTRLEQQKYAAEHGRLSYLFVRHAGLGQVASYWVAEYSDHFSLQPRAALLLFWQAQLLYFHMFGVFSLISAALVSQADENYRKDVVGLVILAVASIVPALILGWRREALQAIILRLASSPEERKAAAIAGLLGGKAPDTAFSRAVDTFKAISVDRLLGDVSAA